ncbi:MAG: glycerate dehydrogenase [Candidatus Muproteobacteria bacterium RBG_16_65_34]|uniref:Glycerate dehydrogenase n=1 Tax=Candidatus Muproteobacteria bacterium RBG_16_65_34 TaxID=1817760 RepID=A0A1F6TSI8_9PROT|nr:MAG: glycerate dehydrogenase [Candidatus Muproteobacteria bacterium RBG_16_65_34]
MERIVFLDRDSLHANLRRPAFAHEWRDYPATAAQEAVARLHEATVAIVNKVPLRQDTLAQLPGLRMIAVCATGTDNVDVEFCRARGIAVANVRNYAVHSVPEHVFMLILALRRNLIAFRADVRDGLWQRAEQFCLFTQPIRDLHGATLGIVGRGVLGAAVGRLGQAFGMRVLYAEHKGADAVRAGYTAFETVLGESDVISLHSPLTAETRHLIDAAELKRMRRDALLINTARGGLVDEAALADALKQGLIGGAGFDVLSREPPREGNPLLDLDLPNFIVTPHVAWSSREAMQAMADQLIDNIERFVRGAPRNLVT